MLFQTNDRIIYYQLAIGDNNYENNKWRAPLLDEKKEQLTARVNPLLWILAYEYSVDKNVWSICRRNVNQWYNFKIIVLQFISTDFSSSEIFIIFKMFPFIIVYYRRQQEVVRWKKSFYYNILVKKTYAIATAKSKAANKKMIVAFMVANCRRAVAWTCQYDLPSNHDFIWPNFGKFYSRRNSAHSTFRARYSCICRSMQDDNRWINLQMNDHSSLSYCQLSKSIGMHTAHTYSHR